MTRLFLIPRHWRALVLLIALLGGLPFVLDNDYFLLLFNIMALNALVVLGLNLLIGSTGQVSLGHAAFYGMGAYLSAIASTTWHWPLACALLFALVLVGIAGFLLALPTLRLEGHYLVMATLGFNIIITIVLGQMEEITGGPSGFPGIPRLSLGALLLNTDRKFYYFIWSIFLVFFAATLNLTDSRLGRAFQAIHEKEMTAQVLGISSHRYKVIVFVLSVLYAAIAGFCYAHYVTFISPKTFDIFYSVQIVTMVVVGGMGSLWGGLAGTALLTCLPELLHRVEDYYVLVYGLILMGVLVLCPQGLVPAVLSLRFPGRGGGTEKLPGSPKTARRAAAPGNIMLPEDTAPVPVSFHRAPAQQPANKGLTAPRPFLELHNISLSFGGLQALQQVTLGAFCGEIVALIGPNGAGKTTVLNVVSGLLKPDHGDVLLQEASILGSAPHRIAAMGIGRTFQAAQVYHKLTVLENTLLGFHLQGRSGFLAACLHSPGERKEEDTLRALALEHLNDFGMDQKAHLPVQQLSLLEQKLLELARALALSPRILLLDEPAGGLNPRESERLVDRISWLRQRGLGIILVEHDMNVVMRLADRVVVLQHGCRIASGTPQQIQQDPRVIAAYLGTKGVRQE